MKHITKYRGVLYESRSTRSVTGDSDYSADNQLADLERLYDIGMIESEELVRERIKIRAQTGQLINLSYAEVNLLDSELAEDIEEWVKDSAMDLMYEFESDDEEEAFDDYMSGEDILELNWQVYPYSTIDIEVFYPALGPDQIFSWMDLTHGTQRSRDILDYYKEPIMRKLDPKETMGRIRLSGSVERRVHELFRNLTTKK